MNRPSRWNIFSCLALARLAAICIVCLFGLRLSAANLPTINLPQNATAAAIQAALDGLPMGGEVLLAAGIYAINQPIILRHDHQTLRGTGKDTILRLAEKANCPVLILGAAISGPQRTVSDVRLTDLFIDGNRSQQDSEFWRAAIDGSQLNNNGIDIWSTKDAVIERVVCCRCRSGGLVSSCGVKNLTVRDYTSFDNQFDGLACYLTTDSHFTGLFLHDNLGAGISLDLDFMHNTIDHAVLTGNDLGVFMRQSRDNKFEGLTIEHSRHFGVFMAQTADDARSGWKLRPGTECTGNSFNGLSVSNCGANAFQINNASCTNNVITGENFVANPKGGLIIASLPPVIAEQLVQR
jgi:hypothetical protein